MSNSLIIPAGGSGKRFGSQLPKQFHLLNDKPVIIGTIEAFKDIYSIENIIIPAPEEHIDTLNSYIKKYEISKNIRVIPGGKERQDSVWNALNTEEAASSDYVLIHDAVRPLVSKQLINKLIETAQITGGAVPGLTPKETIREIMPDGTYSTLDRSRLKSIQTPQVFKTELFKQAFEKANAAGYYSTDDAALFEFAGFDYLIVEGEENNIKITEQQDLFIAEIFLKEINDWKTRKK